VFASSGDLAEAVEQVARLGAQLLLQAALEAEVTAFLGRDRYARAATNEQARPGMRNGYCPTTVKTTTAPGFSGRSCAAPRSGSPPSCSAPG
jgi:putative transposase